MNFFRYFWLSCSGFRGYVALLNLPLRASLGYWVGVSFLIAGIILYNFVHWFNMGYPLIVKEAAPILPEFTISNGQAYSNLPQPYFSNTNQNQFPVILDLNNSITNAQSIYPKGGLVIRQKQADIWMEGSPFPPVQWTGFPNGTVNREYLENLGRTGSRTIPIFFPAIWLVMVLLGIIQAMLFTMLAGLMERSMDPSFTFTQLFNISLFALTPSSLIVCALMSGGIEISYGIVYFAVYCYFVVMASGICRLTLRRPGGPSNGDDPDRGQDPRRDQEEDDDAL